MNASNRKVPSTPRRQNPPPPPQTPRVHKAPSSASVNGIRVLPETALDVKTKVTKKLKLTFSMDDWQAHVIHRIRQRYDSILVAGTGYGKSLIFQGLAALDMKKIVIVISPLKALERDQVRSSNSRTSKI